MGRLETRPTRTRGSLGPLPRSAAVAILGVPAALALTLLGSAGGRGRRRDDWRTLPSGGRCRFG